jgi:hypothetical protein
MYNGMIIKQLLKERNLKTSDLLGAIGSQKANSLTQLTHGNPTVVRIEKVADFFSCSMDVFFERSVVFTPYMGSVIGNGNSVGNINSGRERELMTQVDSMKMLLDEKDKRIKALEEMIDLLKKR